MKYSINQLIVVKSLESPLFFYSFYKECRKNGMSLSESKKEAFSMTLDCAIYNRKDWKKAKKRYL